MSSDHIDWQVPLSSDRRATLRFPRYMTEQDWSLLKEVLGGWLDICHDAVVVDDPDDPFPPEGPDLMALYRGAMEEAAHLIESGESDDALRPLGVRFIDDRPLTDEEREYANKLLPPSSDAQSEEGEDNE